MKRAPFIVFLFFLLLSLFIIVIQSSRVALAIESFFQQAFSVPRNFVVAHMPFRDNTSEIQRLTSENKALMSALYDQKKIQQERDVLYSQIRDMGDASSNLVLAPIVGRIGNFARPKTLIVTVPNDGIARGTPVVLGNNVVGVVSALGGTQARIITIYNPEFETVVATLENDASGVVQGTGTGIEMREVVIGDTLRRGDLVVTRGVVGDRTLYLPESLAIGKVVVVSDNPQASFQKAQVESFIDFEHLTHVFLWTK